MVVELALVQVARTKTNETLIWKYTYSKNSLCRPWRIAFVHGRLDSYVSIRLRQNICISRC